MHGYRRTHEPQKRTFDKTIRVMKIRDDTVGNM